MVAPAAAARALCPALLVLCLGGSGACDAREVPPVHPSARSRSSRVGSAVDERVVASPQGHTLLECPRCEAVRALVDAAALQIARERGAFGVVLVVVDVPSGGLLAVGDYGGASTRAFMPSGTLRPLVIAAAIEDGADPTLIHPSGEGWLPIGPGGIRDTELIGDATLSQMVGRSAVVGPALLARDQLGDGRWGHWMVAFGLMDPQELGPLPWPDWRTMLEATGHEREMSPTAIARAYAVLGNDGRLADGRQLMHQETARAVRDMLESAVTDDGATGTSARVPGVRVGGKTSCAWETGSFSEEQHANRSQSSYCSFVGMLPMEAPRVVLLVGLEAPIGSWEGYGAAAAPFFARLAPQLLELLSAP